MSIYTIGFTKKTAEFFFTILKIKQIDIVIDIRLNNTSQLASFTKYPDIKFFLTELVGCDYIHDLRFAPEECTLRDYKQKKIDWNEYTKQFKQTMSARKIEQYIMDNYLSYKNSNICLLCSENDYKECHRSIVSDYFCSCLNVNVINL